MEEKNLEQLETEPEVQEVQSENSESSIYGKFKDAQTLLDAYNSLQAEFTRKSQKLAEIQKQMEENAVFSKSDSLDEILKDTTNLEKYKKEVTEILDNDCELSNLPNKNLIAFKIIKEAERKTANTLNNQQFIDDYINSNIEIKNKIITEYLSSLNETQSPPKVISGNSSNIYFSPSLNMPKTLKDAGDILTKMLK
ncbi:MAG: hypothetical protein IKJ33_01970 [Clostridia bacterium]|nr:hypothetical protein [Clostridia bacterium]